MENQNNQQLSDLYTAIGNTCGERFSEMERLLSDAREETLEAQAFCALMTRLEESGTAFRKEAIGFLTSGGAAGFDEQQVYETKRHVHTDLGKVLTKTRVFLDAPGDRAPLLSAWTKVLSSLKTGVWEAENVDAARQIAEAAAAAGIRVAFASEIPSEEAALRAYIKDASAKILAAVRAGEAEVTI